MKKINCALFLFMLATFSSTHAADHEALSDDTIPVAMGFYAHESRKQLRENYMLLANRYVHEQYARLPSMLLNTAFRGPTGDDVEAQLDIVVQCQPNYWMLYMYNEFVQVASMDNRLNATQKFMVDLPVSRKLTLYPDCRQGTYSDTLERIVIKQLCRSRTVAELLEIKRGYEQVHPRASATRYQRLIHSVLDQRIRVQ